MGSKGESFSIQVDSIKGRFLVATRDIKQGEVIFQERPLIIGPVGLGFGIEKSKSFSTCLGCYKINKNKYKCSKCGWELCSADCEALPDHANFECLVFADCPVSPITNPPEYEKIKVLRCLMLKEKYPEKWKLLTTLQSHLDTRKQDVYATSCDISYYKFIRQECHLKQFHYNDISHVAGISSINSFNTEGLLGHHHSDGHLRYASFLFYYASLLSHDCKPNSRSVIQQKGKSYVINVIAATNIRQGDSITQSYVDPIFGTLERRHYLLDNFYFSCDCRRCSDNTELGSYVSSIKCNNSSCKNGWLLSKNPTDPNSNWTCNQSPECNNTSVNASVIGKTLQEVKSRMHNSTNLIGLNQTLDMYKEKVLHKNHYLIINMECEMIRLIDEIIPNVDSDEELFRLAKLQVELSRHCLSVSDLIYPGWTKFRGNLLCTLQDSLITICSCRIKQCRSNKDLEFVRKRCKKQLAEAIEIMKEAKDILISEPVSSPEWNRGTILSLETPKIKSLMTWLSFKD